MKISDNNNAEKLGMGMYKTLSDFYSKMSSQEYIISAIDKSIELWKEKLKGEWISNVEAILKEIKNKEEKV